MPKIVKKKVTAKVTTTKRQNCDSSRKGNKGSGVGDPRPRILPKRILEQIKIPFPEIS